MKLGAKVSAGEGATVKDFYPPNLLALFKGDFVCFIYGFPILLFRPFPSFVESVKE